jgi:hypothetical protein
MEGLGSSKKKKKQGWSSPFVSSRSSIQAIMVLALLAGTEKPGPLFTDKWRTNKLLFKQVFNIVGLLPFSILFHSVVLTNYKELLWVMEAHFRN